MTAVIARPDLEAALCTALRSDAGLTALGVSVDVALPDRPQFPYLLVVLAGGSNLLTGHAWVATVDTHALGGWTAPSAALASKASAHDVGAAGEAAIYGLVGSVQGAVTISDVSTVIGMSWLPDPSFDPPQPRYVATYAVTFHA